MTRRNWSESDLTTLAQSGHLTDKQLADHLGRSDKSINKKRREFERRNQIGYQTGSKNNASAS